MRRKIVTVTDGNLERIQRMRGNPRLRAYKASKRNGLSPTYPNACPRLRCRRGAILKVPGADQNAHETCAAGVNVATKWWCVDNHGSQYNPCYKLWLVEFSQADIAVIPLPFRKKIGGKFRLFQCKVLRQVKHKQFLRVQK